MLKARFKALATIDLPNLKHIFYCQPIHIFDNHLFFLTFKIHSYRSPIQDSYPNQRKHEDSNNNSM